MPLAIVHADVITMNDERVLRDRTLVVHRGLITAIERSADMVTDGMEVIDASRKFVMPGLADMHVHLHDATDALLFLANGVTYLRNMWGSPSHLSFRRRVDRGELPGPRLFTTSPIVDGVGANGRPSWPGSDVVTDPAQAEPLVRGYAEQGYQQIKAYSLLTRPVLEALGSAARKAGIPLGGHCPQTVTYEQAIAAGMTSFEHLTAIGNGRTRQSATTASPGSDTGAGALDLSSMQRLADRMAAQQVWNCPTLVVWQQLFQSTDEALETPHLEYQLEERLQSWLPWNDVRLRAMAPMWKQVVAAGRKTNEQLLEIISLLHRDGAPLLLGTDTPNPFVVQGFSVHQELENLRRAGLSCFDALACATSEAARFVGESALWGTVSLRKRADLLILRSNPLRDVTAVRELDAVIANGFLLDRAGLDSILDARASWARTADHRDAAALRTPPRGTTLQQGTLVETLTGVASGCLCFRHSRLADGRLLVEERRSAARGTRMSRVVLTPDHKVARATSVVSTSLGREATSIRWSSEHGRYDIRVRDAVGVQRRSHAGDEMLAPTASFALSVMPQISAAAGACGSSVIRAVSVENGAGDVVEMTLTPEADDGQRRVRLEGPCDGEPATLAFDMGDSGELLGVEQTAASGSRSLASSSG